LIIEIFLQLLADNVFVYLGLLF